MKRKIEAIKNGLILAFVGTLCLVTSLSEGIAADKFPEKPIKLLVGWKSGGVVDLMSQMLAGLATNDLGQPVIVVLKPGASGTIAANEVAHSKPDGYTLVSSPLICFVIAPFQINVKYNSLADFEPLLTYIQGMFGICVRSEAPWKSLKELIEFARGNPGELSVSTTGVGTNPHLAFELIARKENIKWKHVPYPGGAPAATALLGGHVKGHFGTGSHLPFVDSGKFRLLAVDAVKRDPRYPEVPTLIELGYNIPVSSNHIIAAPKGVPEPVLKKLEDTFRKAVKSETFSSFLERIGEQPGGFVDRENTKKTLEEDYRTWGEIFDRLGLKVK